MLRLAQRFPRPQRERPELPDRSLGIRQRSTSVPLEARPVQQLGKRQLCQRSKEATMLSLPAALQSVFSLGGVTLETDASAAVTDINVDYRTKILTMTIQQGTTTGQSFAPGQYPSQYQLMVNMVTGVWFVNG